MANAVKIVLIGDAGVGKSSFLLQYTEQRFSPSYMSTIGVDFKLKNIEVDGTPIMLQIWDTAGQERFRTIAISYYKNAEAAVLMYDCTNADSFEHIKDWNEQLMIHGIEGVRRIIIGNKSDLPNRKVTFDEGQRLASELGAKFMETSALLGQNINETFDTVAKDILGPDITPGGPEKSGKPGKSVSTKQGPEIITRKPRSGNCLRCLC